MAMTPKKKTVVQSVITGARHHSIGVVLFHQAVARLLDVNVTDVKCLDILALEGSATPTLLAARTGLSSGSTTAMIDRLEKQQLVERRANPEDRRGTIVVLTKKAQTTLQRLFEPMAGSMQELVAAYSEDELSVLADFFGKTSRLWEHEREKLPARLGVRRRRRSTSS